ncbi:leucine-rich repeat-containing protein 25 [Dromiciops gliroides]|uniref:leucine-rich repeat-containing protein 25 n=1 Tax=Dromiciops gliroides TaxID=33562 RepID=UPI001CC486CD|nr:leucine-rich repeat-containing protein 25 [Dromiciops gliroides]XP_043832239.1 leucine-rich repeat-containing protein 25 [Dromiciops gliroides]
MQAAGVWLPLPLLCLLLLLYPSKGQNLAQNCSQDSGYTNCSCGLRERWQNCSNIDGMICINHWDKQVSFTTYYQQSCKSLGIGTIVGITLGLLLLLAGVIMGMVLGIYRRRHWDASEPCPRKPLDSSRNSAPVWQPRYSSRSDEHRVPAAAAPSPIDAPGTSHPGALLYENLFLNSQPNDQSPGPRGTSADPEDLYMNYEDNSTSEHPIYGNVDNLTCIPGPQAPPHPGADDEDEYVVPGC